MARGASRELPMHVKSTASPPWGVKVRPALQSRPVSSSNRRSTPEERRAGRRPDELVMVHLPPYPAYSSESRQGKGMRSAGEPSIDSAETRRGRPEGRPRAARSGHYGLTENGA